MILKNRMPSMKFFIDHGYSVVQAAGIVGNLVQESGLDPAVHQIGGGGGFGLAQWTYPARKRMLTEFAKERGVDFTDFQMQLEFIAYELKLRSFRNAESRLRFADNVAESTRVFCVFYEMPGKPMMEKRIQYAMDAYDEYLDSVKDS